MEGAAGTEESGKDPVKGGEEVLARLGFGGGKRGDGGLTINEDICACQMRHARDDVEREDRPTDFGLKDCVLTFCAQVLLVLLPYRSIHHDSHCSYPTLKSRPVREDAEPSLHYAPVHVGSCGILVWRDAHDEH
jgi:hypothetical protein